MTFVLNYHLAQENVRSSAPCAESRLHKRGICGDIIKSIRKKNHSNVRFVRTDVAEGTRLMGTCGFTQVCRPLPPTQTSANPFFSQTSDPTDVFTVQEATNRDSH